MHRFRKVLLVQGTQKEGMIPYRKIYNDPNFQKLTKWTQEILKPFLRTNGIDLARFCQEGESEFSQVQRNIAAQILTFIGNWVKAEEIEAQLISRQHTKRKLTRTLAVGHSFGLWFVAGFFGLWGGKTKKERFQRAVRVIGLRAKYTCIVEGSALLVEKRPEAIDAELLRGTTLAVGDSAVGVVNSFHQVVISGGKEALEQMLPALRAFSYDARDFPLGPPWHCERMVSARKQLERMLSKTKTSRVSVSIAYLNEKGKLKSTKDPVRIKGLLFEELTETYDFLKISLQLPKHAELHEVSNHGIKFLTRLTQSNKAEAEQPQQRQKERTAVPALASAR